MYVTWIYVCACMHIGRSCKALGYRALEALLRRLAAAFDDLRVSLRLESGSTWVQLLSLLHGETGAEVRSPVPTLGAECM